MLLKLTLFALQRRQITTFLGLPYTAKATKAQLIDYLYTLLARDENLCNQLLTHYSYELAVGPNEVQQLLGCSSSERRRWIEEGKLPVLYYRTFLHTCAAYPVHDRKFIMALTPDDIAIWRRDGLERQKSGKLENNGGHSENERIGKPAEQERSARQICDPRLKKALSGKKRFRIGPYIVPVLQWPIYNEQVNLRMKVSVAAALPLLPLCYRGGCSESSSSAKGE